MAPHIGASTWHASNSSLAQNSNSISFSHRRYSGDGRDNRSYTMMGTSVKNGFNYPSDSSNGGFSHPVAGGYGIGGRYAAYDRDRTMSGPDRGRLNSLRQHHALLESEIEREKQALKAGKSLHQKSQKEVNKMNLENWKENQRLAKAYGKNALPAPPSRRMIQAPNQSQDARRPSMSSHPSAGLLMRPTSSSSLRALPAPEASYRPVEGKALPMLPRARSLSRGRSRSASFSNVGGPGNGTMQAQPLYPGSGNTGPTRALIHAPRQIQSHPHPPASHMHQGQPPAPLPVRSTNGNGMVQAPRPRSLSRSRSNVNLKALTNGDTVSRSASMSEPRNSLPPAVLANRKMITNGRGARGSQLPQRKVSFSGATRYQEYPPEQYESDSEAVDSDEYDSDYDPRRSYAHSVSSAGGFSAKPRASSYSSTGSSYGGGVRRRGSNASLGSAPGVTGGGGLINFHLSSKPQPPSGFAVVGDLGRISAFTNSPSGHQGSPPSDEQRMRLMQRLCAVAKERGANAVMGIRIGRGPQGKIWAEGDASRLERNI